MKNIAIILASGTGSRSGLNIPKQFYKINDKTVLEYSIEVFENNEKIDEIIIVSNPDFTEQTKELSTKYTKVIKIICGGKTRQQSSYNGVMSIVDTEANILIHDAVRPFVTKEIINECIYSLDKYNAINVAVESSDTVLEIDENSFIKSIPNRKNLRRVQTPQCFKLDIIKKAHELALKDISFQPTDDCGMVLRYDLSPIYVVNGDEKNIKITYPSDLEIAEKILENKNSY